MDNPMDSSVTEDELTDKIDESSFEGGGINEDSAVAEAFSDLINELSREEQIEMFSDLSAREIRHLSVLKTAGDSISKEFAHRYMKQKISYRRRGRKELIEVSDSIGNSQEVEEQGGRLQKLRSLL